MEERRKGRGDGGRGEERYKVKKGRRDGGSERWMGGGMEERNVRKKGGREEGNKGKKGRGDGDTYGRV